MKICCLLISPPEEENTFPRGIAEIATFLNRHQFTTAILPLGHYLRSTRVEPSGEKTDDSCEAALVAVLSEAIDAVDPIVIGVSNIYTKDANLCTRIVKHCKQLRPTALTVLGGHHATFCDAEALGCKELDLVVRGEGEWVMLELLRTLAGKADWRTVKGISYRFRNHIRRNRPRPAGGLDQLPPIDFGLLPEDFVKSATIHGILTRGCAYQCKYCVEKIYWGNPRSYPLTKQIAEMQMLQSRYDTQLAGLEESMLDMRSARFDAFCRRLENARIELPEQFYITTRIDAVTEAGVKRLAAAGIEIVCVGIESFSQRVLDMMNKRQKPATIRRGCDILARHGLWTNAYWLIGHPGDNPVEADATYAGFRDFFEKGLLQSGHAFIFVPYPGTRYYTHPQRYGIVIGSRDWQRWRRWTDTPVSWLKDFSAEQISRAAAKAWQMLENYRLLNTHLRRAHRSVAEGQAAVGQPDKASAGRSEPVADDGRYPAASI